MPITTTPAGALFAEHSQLVSLEAQAWEAARPLSAGDPGHMEAAQAWVDARAALLAFNAQLAEMRACERGIVELKVHALFAVFGGRLDHIDYAIEAAVEDVAEGGSVSLPHLDTALALSIARDLLAA